MEAAADAPLNMQKIKFKDFVTFQMNLSILSNSKQINPVLKASLKHLATFEYGSHEWTLAQEVLQQHVSAIETFNMWKQILVMIVGGAGHFKVARETVKVLEGLLGQWDTVCGYKAIDNYIEYYKDTKKSPQHPLIYALKTFGENAIQNIDVGQITNSLTNFMKQFGDTPVVVEQAPQQTQTPMVITPPAELIPNELNSTEPMRVQTLPSMPLLDEFEYTPLDKNDYSRVEEDLEMSEEDDFDQHMLE